MQRTASGLLTRSLTACAMVAFYTVSALGVSSFIGTPKAEARGRGGRRGGIGRRGGGGRGRRGRRGGGGFSLYLGAPAAYGSCWWSNRRGRMVCPY
jgi:hypothetical protein